jgi:hypothetical protein
MPRTAASPTFLTVPAGARFSYCRGPNCGVRIYWISDPTSGRLVPIDCEVEGAKRPSETKETGQLDMLVGGEAAVYNGRGVRHHATCPDVEMFRRRE